MSTSKPICPCDPEHSPGQCDDLCCPGGIHRHVRPCKNRKAMTITFDQACAFVEMCHKGIPSAEAFHLLTGFFCPSQNDYVSPTKWRQVNRHLFVAFLRAVATALESVNTVS